MADVMVRASGGFSNANMQAKYREGYDDGVTATKVGTAQAGDVLNGMTFTNGTAVGVTGNMPNRGKYDIVIPSRLNTSQRIPAGYHNGNGVLSVAAPSGTRNLAANEIGNVDLTPYDYQYVNSSAVYAAGQNEAYPRGYNAGLSYASEHLTWELVEHREGHVASNSQLATVQVGNSGHMNKICHVILTMARPKGDGYADPQVYVVGGTDLGTTGYDYSDDTVNTNISTTYRGVKIAAGQTATFTLYNNASKSAAYTYLVMSYYVSE